MHGAEKLTIIYSNFFRRPYGRSVRPEDQRSVTSFFMGADDPTSLPPPQPGAAGTKKLAGKFEIRSSKFETFGLGSFELV
jgi:hypothetical protein